MKRFVLVSILLLSLSSCRSTYYYSVLNTDDEYVEKVGNGDFLMDSDSLWIAYCFKGEGAPIQITVFNKSNKPLYVDWERSALIIDDVAMTYAGKKIDYAGDIDLVITNDRYATGTFDGMAPLPRDISFVPPQSMISEIPLGLNPNFEKIKKVYAGSHLQGKTGKNFKVDKAVFDENNSPLFFRSYLTVYEKPENPMTFEQSFYMSDLIKTHRLSPNGLSSEMLEKGNFFYVQKHPNMSFVEGVLGVSLFVGVVALEVITAPDYD